MFGMGKVPRQLTMYYVVNFTLAATVLKTHLYILSAHQNTPSNNVIQCDCKLKVFILESFNIQFDAKPQNNKIYGIAFHTMLLSLYAS